MELNRRAATLRTVRLGEVISLVIFVNRAVQRLLKHGLGLVDLELALQVTNMVGEGAAVGAAPSVGKAELFVCNVVSKCTPISSATAVLLDLLGVDVGVTALGKEAWKVLRRVSSTLSEALVVTVVGLVGASHV